MIEPEPLMTVEQVAKWLSCSADSVRRYVEREGLPHVRLRSGPKLTLRFSRDAIQRWIDSRTGQAPIPEKSPEATAVAARLWGWDGVVRARRKKAK